MAAIYGYNTPGDSRIFYVKEKCITKSETLGSVMYFITNNSNTQMFNHIVKTAQLEWLLDGYTFHSTIFVPLDDELLRFYSRDFILSMSQELAYRIVKYSILQSKIEYWLLNTLNYSILNPENSYDRIEMSNNNGNIILNNNINVLKLDKVCTNGVILFIDKLLIPYNYS